MTKEVLIQKTIKRLSNLPSDKINEVLDYVDFIAKKYEDEILQKGLTTLIANSKTFEFLNNEEDLYFVEDLKAVYK